MIARLVADKLSIVLGQQVVVENRPGAGGVVGSDCVAKAAPDGYTLIMGNAGSHGINAAVYCQAALRHPARFRAGEPGRRGAERHGHQSRRFPAKHRRRVHRVREGESGKLSYASGGNGSSAHMSMELFKSMAGMDIQHIPYKGSSPALTDLVAGQVAVVHRQHAADRAAREGGKAARAGGDHEVAFGADARASDDRRSRVCPAIETVAWFGVLAPAGTPPEIVNRLSAEIAQDRAVAGNAREARWPWAPSPSAARRRNSAR